MISWQRVLTEREEYERKYRFKPKFCVPLGLLYVDVARLVSFTTEEEKATAANAKDFWHTANFIRVVSALTRISAVVERH